VTVEPRPPDVGDAAGIASAIDEFGRVMKGDRITQNEVEAWLGTPSLDTEHDARVAFVDGKAVGYADIFNSSREGKVTPEKAAALRELLESRGFFFEHFSFRMVAELEDDLPDPEWPEEISVRTFRDEDLRAVHELHQETFGDLRDHSRTPFDVWRHWTLREPFEPGLPFLALADDELAGISICRPEWSGDPSLGWVSVIGVRRPWRGKGLGLALLRHSFRELRARGKTRVGLGVDAENATGAVRLYERTGMEVVRRRLWYEKAVG